MKIKTLAALLAVLAVRASAQNFVDQNTPLMGAKIDKRPLVGPANQSVTAEEMNTFVQSSYDLRSVVQRGCPDGGTLQYLSLDGGAVCLQGGAPVDWIRTDPPDRFRQGSCEWTESQGTHPSMCGGSGWMGFAQSNCTDMTTPTDGGMFAYCEACSLASGGATTFAGYETTGQGVSIQSGLRHQASLRNDPSWANDVVWAAMANSKQLETTCVSLATQSVPSHCSTPVQYIGFRSSSIGADGGPDVNWQACSGDGTNDSCTDTGVATPVYGGDGGIVDLQMGWAVAVHGTGVDFYINGAKVVSNKTNNLPALSVSLGFQTIALANVNAKPAALNVCGELTRY